VLVAYNRPEQLAAALAEQERLHAAGHPAELLGQPVSNQAEAEAVASQRGCSGALWLDS
jgi:hypothetical protein